MEENIIYFVVVVEDEKIVDDEIGAFIKVEVRSNDVKMENVEPKILVKDLVSVVISYS